MIKVSLKSENVYEELFQEVIEEAVWELEQNKKWNDRFLKEKLPKKYCDAIRKLYGVKGDMSEKDFSAFTDYVYKSLAKYRKYPINEYDEKYKEAVINKIEEEARQSNRNAPKRLLDEAEEAFREACDEMSRIKMQQQLQKRGLEVPCMN